LSYLPDSPLTMRGALVGADPANPVAAAILFQYNPDSVTRQIQPRAAGGETSGARSEALRLVGPPRETITMDVEIDVSDQLALGSPQAELVGIYPTLSALEMLLYPKSSTAIANEALAATGVIEIIPPPAPLTLLVWGAQRVVPVRLTSLTITEEAHDPLLNPIRARAGLTLEVLTYQDLARSNPGYSIFFTHQVAKEVLAVSNLAVDALLAASSLKTI
jgi:hypothetical protein